jgi:hypothetical protein
MMATSTKFIVEQVVIIDKSRNMFWPGPTGMDHRQVFLDVQYTTQALSAFKIKAGPCLKSNLTKKYIVYVNMCATIKHIITKLCD